jgi:3-oxoacyl-(acyl-carrier-protein) synthase
MALKDAGWHPASDEDQIATGVMIGSGIGGLEGIVEAGYTLRDKGPRRISPFFIPGRLINLISGHVSIRNKLRGPNHAVVTACSTGAHAIGDAARLIALGDADVMVAGGAEAAISRIGLAGFAACKALSTSFNDTPKRRRVPMTVTATVSSWVRGPRSWCLKSSTMRWRAAPTSWPKCRATGCRATPITSPRRQRMATAPIAA